MSANHVPMPRVAEIVDWKQWPEQKWAVLMQGLRILMANPSSPVRIPIPEAVGQEGNIWLSKRKWRIRKRAHTYAARLGISIHTSFDDHNMYIARTDL